MTLYVHSRCGTLDELDVSVDNECACEAKEGAGSGYGQWVDLELLNVPFLSAMLDPASTDFKNVKRIVETTVGTFVTHLVDENLLLT